MLTVPGGRLWLALVGLVLLASAVPGTVGQVGDGRQMIFTAVAIAETGSLGQARGRDLTVPRAAGDSVSRYGMGMSLLQVPAAFLAPVVESRYGPGSSQWLFLVAPFVLVLATAVIAGRIVRQLGGTRAAQRDALLLATIASPLGVYAATDFSEPLQALALSASYAAAVRAVDAPWRRGLPLDAIVAGGFVGLALLTKSSLIVVAPLTLAPLFLLPRDRALKTWQAVMVGLAPLVALWLYFEITRFGRPFAGYAGEGFTHPFVDGAWRLLVGVNKGLLLYFPAALALTAALLRVRRMDRRALMLAGAFLPMAGLWLLAAPWWAWHGVDGWGPRLLVPGIPLLAVQVSLEMRAWRAPLRVALVIACIVLNLPPVFQHPTPVVRYMWLSTWPEVDAETAQRLPAFARRTIDGHTVIPPDQVLASVRSASPFLVLPWFFRAMHADPAERLARLNAPPWLAERPDIRPDPPLTEERVAVVAQPWFAVYDAALSDQVMRAQQLRQTDRALALARKLETLAPSGAADALLLESFRLLHQKEFAIDWLTQLPLERRQNPAINVVLALWDRDEGKDEEAHALLRSSAAAYPTTVLQRALSSPLAEWPADFASMTADPSLEVR